MAIRVRRGLKEQFIASKLLPGEFAVATDTGTGWYCFKAGNVKLIATTDDIEKVMQDYDACQEDIAAIQTEMDAAKRAILELQNGAAKYPIATKEEALAAEANDKLMSPLRTGQLISEMVKDVIKYPIATEQEARAGIDDNKLMTPLKVAQAIEELASGGGGGGGSTIPIMSSTFAGGSFAAGTEIEIRYRWSSPNEGYGTLHVLLNNVEIITEEVQQGLNRAVIPGQVKGNYTLLMYVEDRGGLTTDKLTFTLKVGGLDITSTFDDSQDFTIKSVIRIPVTIDTISLDPIYINTTIDNITTRTAGQNGYNMVQLPALTPGAHKVSIKVTSGVYVSNILQFNIIIEDADTLTIICDYEVEQVSYRDLVEIPYRVSLKGVDRFNAEYLVDGIVKKTLEIKSGTNIWSTRDLEVGDHVLRINVATLDGTKTAYVEKSLRVNASSYTPLQPVIDASLVAWFDAAGRTNQDTDRDVWPDKSGNGTTARLVNFNFGSNNGWIDNTLKCNGGSYVEIDLQPLKDNAPYGLTVDIKFKTRDSGEELDCVLDMRGSDANSRGFAVDTKYMYMNSGTTQAKSTVLEEEISRATFVIDRQNKLAKIYNNGVMTEAFIIQATETFTNNSKIYLGARLANVSGVWGPAYYSDCEVYSIRVYERALESDEIVQNHIADIPDLTEQEEKYRLNYENMMPTMYFYGDTSAMTKDNKVPLRIRYISTDSNKYGESFDLPTCQVGWQGTSSLQYAVKNYKIKLKDQDGAKYKYSPFPNGILEDTFCLKADYMESSHANNTGMARFINDCLYDSKVPPQETNPNVRTTIDGFPIQLYIAQNSDATPVYMGVFNFNLDKGCNDSFGFDENTISFEVASNSDTSAGAFKDDSDASMRQDFELRYPDEDDCTPEQVDAAYASMKRAVTWVKNSTEETFRAEVEQYFNLEYLLKYYLQVHLFGMVDNLGKNMMLTTWDGLVWYPQFYDMDTQLGLDNTGYLEFLSDIDVVAGVYNTSGSKLWTMVSTVFADELAEKYKAMRGSTYTIDNILKYWYGDQVAKIGEKQYNADMEAKYIQFKSDYLFMLHGRRYEHMRRWITERLLYLDTIYGYEADTRQSITIRANKSGSVYLDIHTYSPQYVRVVWRNGVEQKLKVGRDTKGNMVKTRFSSTLATGTDQEIIIYNAKHIKKIDNISGLSPSVLNMVEANKLTELSCSNATLLNDVRLSGNNRFLRDLSFYGCKALGTSSGGGNVLDLSQMLNMRTLDVRGTALDNILFPTGGSNFESLYIPDNLKQIDLENMPLLKKIQYGSKEGFKRENTFTSMKIINCPRLPATYIKNVHTENLWLENSLAGSLDDTVINTQQSSSDPSCDMSTIKIKGLNCFESGRLKIVAGQNYTTVPATNNFEITNTKVGELVLIKLGFIEETIVDLSNEYIGSLCILEYANIKELILPSTLTGLSIRKNVFNNVDYGEKSPSYIGSTQKFPDTLKDMEFYVNGKTIGTIDLSSLEIAEYLNIDDLKGKNIKINCDFSLGTGGYLKWQSQRRFYLGKPGEVTGNVICTDDAKLYGTSSEMENVQEFKLVINTSRVTGFSNFFEGFTNLIAIPEIDTSNGTNFFSMFKGCSTITTIPQLDTLNGTNFGRMFYDCQSLLSIPQIDTSQGTNFTEMFYGCSMLSEIPPINTANGVTFNSMFNGCTVLQNVPLLNTSKAVTFENLFYACKQLKAIPQFDTSQCSNFSNMFYGCNQLESIPTLNTSAGTNFSDMFTACYALETIPELDLTNGKKFSSMFSKCKELRILPRLNTVNGTSFAQMITDCDKLERVNGLNLSNRGDTASNTIYNVGLLKEVIFEGTLNEYAGKYDLLYPTWNNTAVESIINALVDYSGGTAKVLRINSNVIAALTEDQVVAITEKNWTIQS
mgnify:CR=1 FL=1